MRATKEKTWMETTAMREEQRQPGPGEYIGADGLIYCEKCRTSRQVLVPWIVLDGLVLKMPCLCDCQAAELDREKKGLGPKVIEERRAACFRMNIAAAGWTFAEDDGKTPKMAVARQYVEHWHEMKHCGRGLLLYGPPGSGKSYMAAAIANALIDRGFRCKMTTFSHLADLEKTGVGADDFRQYDLLILDDLDAERNTSYMREIVHRVIDARTAEKAPLIVTTNTSYKDMRAEIDIGKKRVYSRICGVCVPIPVTGEDRRIVGSYENARRMMEQLQGGTR